MKIKFGFGTRAQPVSFIDPEEWAEKSPVWKQVHGTRAIELTQIGQECGEVDAFWTRTPRLPIAVKTADCIPILLKHADLKAVAAIHAGWKGVELHIIQNFFRSLPSAFSNPKEWVAMIGPSNRACCYEFGADLIQKFAIEFPTMELSQISPREGYFDLIAVVKHELGALGVQIESIHPDCTFCTRESDGTLRYLSYRRGDRNSRQYSGIIL